MIIQCSRNAQTFLRIVHSPRTTPPSILWPQTTSVLFRCRQANQVVSQKLNVGFPSSNYVLLSHYNLFGESFAT